MSRSLMAELASRSTDEQLAYWLNLHNVLVIDHIAHLYPKKFLDDLYQGEQPWAVQRQQGGVWRERQLPQRSHPYPPPQA